MTMPDPTTHTAIAVATGASSASMVAGAFFGVEYVVIGLALLGGSIAHIWLARMAIRQMLLSIFGSTTLGVICSQFFTNIFIETAKHFAPWLVESLAGANIGSKMIVAFFIAFVAQKAVPLFFNWLDSKGGVKQ
jgi:ABC-type enterobactin transport system permease subunit